MFRFVPLLLLSGFAADVASIIWVGGWIGVLPTLLLLVAGGIVGAALFRSAGVNAANMLRQPLAGPSQGRELAGTTLARVAAGLLFILPGFASDFLGLLLLLPAVQRQITARMKLEPQFRKEARPSPRGAVIDAEAIEITGEVENPPAAKSRSESTP